METTHLPNSENLLVHFRRIEQLKKMAVDMPSRLLDTEELCDLELLLNRGFFPLQGYMQAADYESVLESMHLQSGDFWPYPITLSLDATTAELAEKARMLTLRDPEGFLLAILHVQDIWQPDLEREAQAIYGTTDGALHPQVKNLLQQKGCYYVGGRIEGLHFPQHYDFTSLRRPPSDLHRIFSERGWGRIMAYQSEEPPHRMQREMLLNTAVEKGAKLLLTPLIGPTALSDVEHFTLVRCYRHFMQHLPRNAALLNLTPMRWRGAGPKGALLQAAIIRNYGCTHFLVHAHHDDPLKNELNTPRFYPPEIAFDALLKHEKDLDIVPILERPRVYVPEFSMFILPEEVKEDVATQVISHKQLCNMLAKGEDIPDWVTFPEVVGELRHSMPPRSQQGFTIFLTGLSGAGKSTLAKVLYVKLLELQGRPVTLLDGDIVRRNLSSELDFSKKHRNLNVTRIGFVASEITKNKGIAICAPIAPYEESRSEVRRMISKHGGFVEVFMSTPLEVCEQRDRKGLYAKARAGVIKGVTGIDDPYEQPLQPDVVVDTTTFTPSEGARVILEHLQEKGYLSLSLPEDKD